MKKTFSLCIVVVTLVCVIMGCETDPMKNIEGNYQTKKDETHGDVTLKISKTDEGYSYVLFTSTKRITKKYSGTAILSVSEDKKRWPRIILSGISRNEEFDTITLQKNGSLIFNNQPYAEDGNLEMVLPEIYANSIQMFKIKPQIDFSALEAEADRISNLITKNGTVFVSESIQNTQEAFQSGLINKFDEIILPAPTFTEVVDRKIGIYTVYGLKSSASFYVYMLGNPTFSPLAGFRSLTTSLMGIDGSYLQMIARQGVQQEFVKPAKKLGKYIIVSIIPDKYEDKTYFVIVGNGYSSIEDATKYIGRNNMLIKLKQVGGLDMDS